LTANHRHDSILEQSSAKEFQCVSYFCRGTQEEPNDLNTWMTAIYVAWELIRSCEVHKKWPISFFFECRHPLRAGATSFTPGRQPPFDLFAWVFLSMLTHCSGWRPVARKATPPRNEKRGFTPENPMFRDPQPLA
jgi:hypothetical protein